MKSQAAPLHDALCQSVQTPSQIPPDRPEFPVPLRQRVVAYVLQQRQLGKSLAQCAKELGLPKARLHYWLYHRGKGQGAQPASPQAPQPDSSLPAWRPVQLASTLGPPQDGGPPRRFLLRSPAGWTLSELSLQDLAELLRSLA